MKNKIEFLTEIYVTNEADPAPMGIGVGPTEDASIEEAIKHLKTHNYATGQITFMETYQVPQHYTADELA